MNISEEIKDKLYDRIASKVGIILEGVVNTIDIDELIDEDYVKEKIKENLAQKICDYASDIVDDIIDDVTEDLDY